MPGCLSTPANVSMENKMKTRRQLRALESRGMEQPLLFLENYKRGVGSMSISAHNHNNKCSTKVETLSSVISGKRSSCGRKSAARWFEDSSCSIHQMPTSQKKKSGSDGIKKPTLSKHKETPKTSSSAATSVCNSRTSKTPSSPKRTRKEITARLFSDMVSNSVTRRRGRPRKNSPSRDSEGRSDRVTRPSSMRYSFPIPNSPTCRNQSKVEFRSSRLNVKTGRCSRKRSAPLLSLGDNVKTVNHSPKRSAPSPSPSDSVKTVKCSPKQSPPSLSEEERSAASFPAITNSAFNNVGRNRHEGPPIALIQRKRHLVELFDSILPTDICDGRMDFEELKNRIRHFVAGLIAAANQREAQRAPNIDYNNHYAVRPLRAVAPANQFCLENFLSPATNAYSHPYQQQNYSDSGGRPLSNVRMISEGREENYGLGAFQDAHIRALLPNTPVYSAARLRNLVHSNGMAMTERENTEIVPVEKLDSRQLQLLQEKGFRLVTLDLPTDRGSLTNMQRMALADMCDENTKNKKSITC